MSDMSHELDVYSGNRFAPRYVFAGVPTISSSSMISVVMCSITYFAIFARNTGATSPANF